MHACMFLASHSHSHQVLVAEGCATLQTPLPVLWLPGFLAIHAFEHCLARRSQVSDVHIAEGRMISQMTTAGV